MQRICWALRSQQVWIICLESTILSFGRRTEDKTIFGFLYGQFSRDYAQNIVSQGGGNPNHEMIVELAHRIQVVKYTFFQPDMQWDLKPAGTSRIPNAFVLGAEIGISF